MDNEDQLQEECRKSLGKITLSSLYFQLTVTYLLKRQPLGFTILLFTILTFSSLKNLCALLLNTHSFFFFFFYQVWSLWNKNSLLELETWLRVRSTCCSAGEPKLIPTTYPGQLTATCNCLQRTQLLFWSLWWTLCLCNVCAHTDTQVHTITNKRNLLKAAWLSCSHSTLV